MREGCHETPRGDDLLVVGTEEKWLVTHDLSCRSPSLSGSTGWVWRMKLGYERRLRQRQGWHHLSGDGCWEEDSFSSRGSVMPLTSAGGCWGAGEGRGPGTGLF